MKPYFLSIVCLLLLSACASRPRKDAVQKPGTYKLKTDLTFNGLSRTYLFHIPKTGTTTNRPLVIVLHGAFNTAKGIEEQTGFSALADEKGFYVAYPNGIGLFGLLQHWNAGHCCGKAAKDNVDDVGFLNTILDDLLNTFPIDSNRIYVVGHSNGGMMAYRYAAECANRLAGAAVVSGAIGSTTADREEWCLPAPARPVPMLMIHGTADRAIPFEGGASPDKPDAAVFKSTTDALDFWMEANGKNAPTELILLKDWGHDWPGPYFISKKRAPVDLSHYDAAKTIWTFFEQNITPPEHPSSSESSGHRPE